MLYCAPVKWAQPISSCDEVQISAVNIFVKIALAGDVNGFGRQYISLIPNFRIYYVEVSRIKFLIRRLFDPAIGSANEL